MASKVHRVRYYNPKPQPIYCISLNKSSKLLAAARGDASIEIWDLNYAPYLVTFIPGDENGSVEALCWVRDRLLSTGLGGALIEWDLEKLCPKTTVLLTGYAAWCLDVNPDNTLVAIGTEQGYVNLYSVANDEIIYKKLFDKQEGRILCCKFNKTGNILVTGSVNSIRVWNVETGHATCRMSVSRRGKETIVWCLAVLTDNVVVSGDSLGRLTFWDGAMGDQIESYSTHRSDILSIAVSDDEKNLYCSGVDPLIAHFIKVNKSASNDSDLQWVKHVQRNIHEHDVRGLVLNGNDLISIGIDGYLTLSGFPPKWVMRIPPMLPTSRSSVCAKKKLLLLRYSNHLEVWKLGTYATNSTGTVMITNVTANEYKQPDNNELEKDSAIAPTDKVKIIENTIQSNIKLTESPVKLVSVQTKKKKQMRCCELSPSGEFVTYSTDNDMRMLKLDVDEEQTNISASKMLISGVTSPCDHVAFTSDSRTMVVHCVGARALHVFNIDPEAGAALVYTIQTDKYFKTSSILHLYISNPCPKGVTYLVVADTQGAISVWTRSTKKFEHYVSLPKYQCVPSALTVDYVKQNLIVVYVDQKIIEYELLNKKFSDLSAATPPEWWSRHAAVTSVSAHPTRDAIVFQDDNSLWIMERTVQEPAEPALKKNTQTTEPGSLNMPLKIVPIKYLAGFHWLGSDEAVAVQILPENIIAQLPAPMASSKRNANG